MASLKERRDRFDAALLNAVPSHAECIARRARLTVNVGTCDCPGPQFHAAIREAWDTALIITRHDGSAAR